MRNGRLRLLGLLLGLLALTAACCTTVGAPEDYPILPLPEKALEESVTSVAKDGGLFLSEVEALKLARNFENLRAERDALRRTAKEYNDWAKERLGQ